VHVACCALLTTSVSWYRLPMCATPQIGLPLCHAAQPLRSTPCVPFAPLYVPCAGSSYPTRDDNGHLLQTEYGKCRYKDNQIVGLQELPETAPPGQLPHGGAWKGQQRKRHRSGITCGRRGAPTWKTGALCCACGVRAINQPQCPYTRLFLATHQHAPVLTGKLIPADPSACWMMQTMGRCP
jgi:hypothetical protein